MILMQNLKDDIIAKIKLYEKSTDPDLIAKRESLEFCRDDSTFIIEEMIDDLLAENELFFQFAFMLRKKDPTCKYTKQFLSRIKP